MSGPLPLLRPLAADAPSTQEGHLAGRVGSGRPAAAGARRLRADVIAWVGLLALIAVILWVGLAW